MNKDTEGRLLAAARQAREALIELAHHPAFEDNAPEFNEGGVGWEATAALRRVLEEIDGPPMTLPGGAIFATAWSDDRVIEIEFDARPWFWTAETEEIVDLAKCGWRGSEPSDQVAMYMAEQHDGLADLFKYLELVNNRGSVRETVGFECSVNEDEAVQWLEKHRPHAHKDVLKELSDG